MAKQEASWNQEALVGWVAMGRVPVCGSGGQLRSPAIAAWEGGPGTAATSSASSREAKIRALMCHLSVFKKCWQLLPLKFKT